MLTEMPEGTHNDSATPRKVEEVNAPSRHPDERSRGIESILDDLANPNSQLGEELRKVGEEVGGKEARNLQGKLTSLLSGRMEGLSKDKQKLLRKLNKPTRKEDKKAISKIAKQIDKAKSNNPLIAAGQLVCEEVAREFVHRLTRWADVANAMAEAKKFNQFSLTEDVAVAKQWNVNLGLDFAKADGLYMLAQQIGKEIGDEMKRQDPANLSSLKEHCVDGSGIGGVIDEYYSLIAKQVAIKIAPSLMLRVEDLPKTLFNAEDTRNRVSRRPVAKLPPREEQPYEPGMIISPANPALVPSELTEPQASAQDPGNTAVQQEPKHEEATISPANPDNLGPSDKTNT
jgi:hypothetical protein